MLISLFRLRFELIVGSKLYIHYCIFSLSFLLCSISIDGASGTFDPYQLNGGLISAVAGKDFVVVATDTRLIGPGGYDILERSHTASRLWSPLPIFSESSSSSSSSHSSSSSTGSRNSGSGINNVVPHSHDGSITLPTQNLHPKLFESPTIRNNSIIDKKDNKRSVITNSKLKEFEEIKLISSWTTKRTRNTITPNNIMIGSAGCSADCEVLKRTIRSEVRTARYFGELSMTVTPMQIAILLSQILYSRRGFPYYSFCLVAGIDDIGVGQVFVFDAIGSYEQVAVACTGTGRELMQPILDRKFRSLYNTARRNERCIEDVVDTSSSARKVTTEGDIPADYGRNLVLEKKPLRQRGHFISERSTTVDSSNVEEVISILIDAYRAVSEREIGVGDQIVLYTIQRKSDNDGMTQFRLYSAPLKKH